MAITAKDVAKLRQMTGVGMMKCKEALVASDGDMDKAVIYLREKGLAAQQKKAGKIAAEGVSYTLVENGVGVIVEVNSQTDFVAKNEKFQTFVKDVASVIAEKAPADLDALMRLQYPGTNRTVQEVQNDNILVIGENIKIRRFARVDTGYSFGYVHMGGRIAVLVNLDVPADKVNDPKVAEVANMLCLQVCSMKPLYVAKENVPAEEVEKEKAIQLAKAEEEGAQNTKIPEEKRKMIAENKVKGRMANFYKEICLLDQGYFADEKKSVGTYLAEENKALGGEIKVKSFIRYETGEGIEKAEENFAEEVASMIK